MRPSASKRAKADQLGAAAIEFALVAIIFFTLILGIMDFGRWVYKLNAASEATRYGARVAVVCDLNDSAVQDRMRIFLPEAANANISVAYSPTGCTAATCESVTVSLSNLSIGGVAWFLPSGLPIPPFSHTLTRESMQSAIDGRSNPMCQ